MNLSHTLAGVALGLMLAAPVVVAAEQPASAYTGPPLTATHKAHLKHTAWHLPACKPRRVSGCRYYEPARHRTLASFRADGRQWYVEITRGVLTDVEVYR